MSKKSMKVEEVRQLADAAIEHAFRTAMPEDLDRQVRKDVYMAAVGYIDQQVGAPDHRQE